MLIEQLTIKNFRSIRHLELNNLKTSPIITFIGSLSSGKSNLLRSFELFWNPSIYKQEQDLASEREFYSSLTPTNSQDSSTIEGQWHLLNLFDPFLTTKQPSSLNSAFLDIVSENNPVKFIIGFSFDPLNDTKPARRFGWKAVDSPKIEWLEEDPYDSVLEDIHNALGSLLIHRFRGEWNIDVQQCLIEIQDKPEQKYYLEKLFSRILGESIQFSCHDHPNAGEVVVVLYENGSILPFIFLSHSTKRLLAILTTLLPPENQYTFPKVLLIDNPEIGDPKAQRVLAEIFIEHAPPHQILISTQSPRFMIGSVYSVRLQHSYSHIKPIRTEKDLSQVVKLLGIRPSDSLSADAVVFVEGSMDAAVFRIFLQKVTQNYRETHFDQPPLVSFIPVDGWTKMSFTISVRVLRQKYVRTKGYAILDGDTWRIQPHLFSRIQQSFQSIFGKHSFLTLKESCLETIFLKQPTILAKIFQQSENNILAQIKELRQRKVKDKQILIHFVENYNNVLSTKIWSSALASKIAKEFTIEQIPKRIRKLFKRILWDRSQ
ncbi:MAG: ATP-dependent endonuclease [Candidatus Hodarchaeota archaeon]